MKGAVVKQGVVLTFHLVMFHHLLFDHSLLHVALCCTVSCSTTASFMLCSCCNMVVKMKVHDTLRQCKLAVPEAVRHGPICADTGQELDAWHEYLEQVQKERMEEELWFSTGKQSEFNICHACGDRLCLYCHNSTNRGCEKCPESKGARNVPSRKPLWSDEDEMAELYKYDYVFLYFVLYLF